MIISIQELLDIHTYGRSGSVREACSDEEPDFVQERDKLCTGMSGRKNLGVAFSFDLEPPVLLRAGVGYVIDIEEA